MVVMDLVNQPQPQVVYPPTSPPGYHSYPLSYPTQPCYKHP